MGPLKKITYNCQKATFLIEKKLVDRITLREQLELRIHLFGCSVCRLYRHQTKKITEMVHQLFNDRIDIEKQLDDTFKKDLQERIENELDKN